MAAKFRAAMPNHRRHHSWPPIRLLPSHLQHHTAFPARAPVAAEIDEDPFAFFVSSPSDPDDRFREHHMPGDDSDDDEHESYISDWMNANIEEPARLRRRTRSVSPFGRRGRRPASHRGGSGSASDDDDNVTDNYAYAAAQIQRPVSPGTAVAMLRGWLDRMEKMYFLKKPGYVGGKLAGMVPLPTEKPVSIQPFPISPPLTPRYSASAPLAPAALSTPQLPVAPVRGRKRVRRSSRSVGNRAIRSYAGHVRAWREPSEDMYPLSEEEEYEEIHSPMSV